MANLTLRQTAPGSPKPNIVYKGSPLSHVELDANFEALDSEFSAGIFDSGLEVSGGLDLLTGDLEIHDGNLILNDGNIHYNPKLKWHDDVSNTDTMAIDSTGALLVGTMNNAQGVKMKVARTGNQHTLVGSLVSNSGQITRAEYGPAGGTSDTGSGLKATQATSNFSDWSLTLFASNSTDGYVDGITIDKDGNTTVHGDMTVQGEARFEDAVIMDSSLTVNGDLNVLGDLLNNGSPIASGTVESVAMTVPTGFAISGSPITTSGTLALAMDAGYSIPQSSSQTNWDTAYGWGDHSTAGYASASRSINTGNGLSGGGDLSADRTLSMSGSYTGTFTASGDVVAYSDIAMKSNINPITDALDKVAQITGYTYNKEGDDSRRTGVIAQEIEKVLPEAIHKSEDGVLGVAYGNLTGLLIEAIKDLRAEVEELKKG